MGLPADLGGSRHCPHCAGGLETRRPPADQRDRLVCSRCGFILYLGPKVAAGTVPLVDGRILLIRRGVPPGEGLWSFPCGYVEVDETLEACAVRETREEAGVEVRLEGLLGAYSYPPGAEGGGRVAIVVYAASVAAGRPAAGDDATEVGLFAPGEIPWAGLAFLSSRDALRDRLARLGITSPGRSPSPG